MKEKLRIGVLILLILILPGFKIFCIDSVEIGFGCSGHQIESTYFMDLEPPLLEMSYYGHIALNELLSLRLSYYSHAQYIGYYYTGDPLIYDNWTGPYYNAELVPSGYPNSAGLCQMHIFDIGFGFTKRISFLDILVEIGPTVIIPGTIIRSSWDAETEPFASMPEGWYEILNSYAAETGGNLPILGANCGLGFKVHLWYFTIWGAARYRYTWGIPAADLLNNFELSFGTGLELYSKQK